MGMWDERPYHALSWAENDNGKGGNKVGVMKNKRDRLKVGIPSKKGKMRKKGKRPLLGKTTAAVRKRL